LLVEDEIDAAEKLTAAILSVVAAEVALARNRDEALDLIRDRDFDYVICDLRLPPRDGTAETNSVYGLEVHHALRDISAGTPSVFFTGVNDHVSVRDAIQDAERHDVFGTNSEYPLVALLFKDEMRRCLQGVKDIADHIDQLEAIEVLAVNGSALSRMHERILRIYARRNSGKRISIERKSGLSGVDTLVATVENVSGQPTARVFCKLGPRAKIVAERDVFSQNVPQLLDSRTFAPLIDSVVAGAGREAGIFFSIAAGYKEDFFSIVDDSSKLLTCIATVRGLLSPWANLQEVAERPAREWLPTSVDLDSIEALLGKDAAVCDPNFWTTPRSVKLAKQHGDLHGQNILTGGRSAGYLIDFAAAGLLPACLDPITLELSLLFHMDSPIKGGGWPTKEQAANWGDLDSYLVGCPCVEAVSALREWAQEQASSHQEVEFVALLHVLRQAKYVDTDKDLVATIAKGLIEKLGL
jgi:CheY-like chemotaxis protein